MYTWCIVVILLFVLTCINSYNITYFSSHLIPRKFACDIEYKNSSRLVSLQLNEYNASNIVLEFSDYVQYTENVNINSISYPWSIFQGNKSHLCSNHFSNHTSQFILKLQKIDNNNVISLTEQQKSVLQQNTSSLFILSNDTEWIGWITKQCVQTIKDPIPSSNSSTIDALYEFLKNWKVWFTLGTVFVMLICLVLELYEPYFVVFSAMVVLMLSQIISLQEAVAGYSNEGMITVGVLFPVVLPLAESGVLSFLAKYVFGSSKYTRITLLRMMICITLLSSIFNNTPLVALFIPVIKDYCRDQGVYPSLFLLPLSYSAIIGGVTTLIGSATNIIVNGMLKTAKEPEFGFFEIGYLGIPGAIATIIYMVCIGVMLLPRKGSGMFRLAVEKGENFLSEIEIVSGSPYIGKKIKDLVTRLGSGVEIVEIIRESPVSISIRQEIEEMENNQEQQREVQIVEKQRIVPVPENEVIVKGDRLIIAGNGEAIRNIHSITGVLSKVKLNLLEMIGTDKIVEENTTQETDEKLKIFPFPKTTIQQRLSLDGLREDQITDAIVENSKPELQPSATADETVASEQSNTKQESIIDAKEVHEKKKEEDVEPEFFEVVVGRNCFAVDRKIEERIFQKYYDASILAVRRKGENISVSNFGDIQVKVGDALLLLAKPSFYSKFINSNEFYVISRCGGDPLLTTNSKYSFTLFGRKFNFWWWKFACFPVFITMIACVTAGIPMLKCAMTAFFVMVLLKIINPSDAIKAVDWKLMVLVGASFAVGKGITNSGLANVFSLIVRLIQLPEFLLPGFIFLCTQLVTSVITNNAAAALLFPVAMATASINQVNNRAFAVAVAVAASADFSTPIGYQTNLMVQNPGGYRFVDYIKVGLPINILYLITATILLPLIWPLR